MELMVKEFKTPKEITFNYEELKAAVAEKMTYYRNASYTEDQLKEAKEDRATLNKFVAAIDGRRKEIKAEILKPYTEFETKINEIKQLVNEPIALIDSQVKTYEEMQKRNKEESIRTTWANIGGCPGFDVDQIWNPKWLNATYSMKQIAEDMKEAIEKINNELAIIDRLAEYRFEAVDEYKETLSLTRALAKADYLRDQAMRKAQAEAQMAEAAKQAEAQINEMAETDEAQEETPAEAKRWISFQLYMNNTQARELAMFLRNRNIQIRKGE